MYYAQVLRRTIVFNITSLEYGENLRGSVHLMELSYALSSVALKVQSSKKSSLAE